MPRCQTGILGKFTNSFAIFGPRRDGFDGVLKATETFAAFVLFLCLLPVAPDRDVVGVRIGCGGGVALDAETIGAGIAKINQHGRRIGRQAVGIKQKDVVRSHAMGIRVQVAGLVGKLGAVGFLRHMTTAKWITRHVGDSDVPGNVGVIGVDRKVV